MYHPLAIRRQSEDIKSSPGLGQAMAVVLHKKSRSIAAAWAWQKNKKPRDIELREPQPGNHTAMEPNFVHWRFYCNQYQTKVKFQD